MILGGAPLASSPLGSAAKYGAAYSLTADAGTFALTGLDVDLTAARRLAATTQALTLTGQDAAFARGYQVSAQVQTYTLTGQDATLQTGRRLTAEAATFNLTGRAAGLVYQTVGSYTMVATAASFTLADQDAGLLQGRRLGADTTAYTWTGSAVDWIRTYRLPLDTGGFTVAGVPATITYSAADYMDGLVYYRRATLAGLDADRTVADGRTVRTLET